VSWKDCRLGDVLRLKRGHDLPNQARQPGEIPVVSSSGVTGFHSAAKAEPPGVITGRYGTLGEVFYLQEPYWPLNTALYVIDFKGTHPRFAAYVLKNALVGYQSDKAAVPGVDRNVLHELRVRVPDSPIQERIATILSAYDELIEKNRRRMALLEESARLLYREWFVRLRFPGYEHTQIVDGAPQGWQRKSLNDLAFIVMGQSPESKYYNDAGEGLPFHQGVTDFTDRFVKDRVFCTRPTRLAETGDILCSVRAPVGRVNITLNKVAIGRGLTALRSKSGNQSFLFQQLRTHFFKEDLIGAGAIFASVTRREFGSQELLTPDDALIHDFEEISTDADGQLRVLSMQNEKLRAARDLLLPKLMSGELPV